MNNKMTHSNFPDAATAALERYVATVMQRVAEKLRRSENPDHAVAADAFEFDPSMGTACFTYEFKTGRWFAFYATPFFEHTDGIAIDVTINGESLPDRDSAVLDYGITFDVDTDADAYIDVAVEYWMNALGSTELE